MIMKCKWLLNQKRPGVVGRLHIRPGDRMAMASPALQPSMWNVLLAVAVAGTTFSSVADIHNDEDGIL